MAWASCPSLAADDWIVVAQQHDEPVNEFTERVRHRARRLHKEDTKLESVDVYAAPHGDAHRSAARRGVLEELGLQMAPGGQLTLWSASENDPASNAELAGILAQIGPILAKRQIAMNHQACEPEQQSGVRHAIPSGPPTQTAEAYEELA